MKNFIKTFFLTKPIYILYSKVRKMVLHKIRNRRIQKKGGKTLLELNSILAESGFFFFFDMGTLLGLIREGHILKHDLDIDIGIKVNDKADVDRINAFLASKGCEKYITLVVQEIGIVEESFKINGIKFDVSFYFSNGNEDNVYLLYLKPGYSYSSSKERHVVRLSCPPIQKTTTIVSYETQLTVPENPEEYLAVRYGAGWRIPDKNYVYWKGPSAHETEYFGSRVVENKRR